MTSKGWVWVAFSLVGALHCGTRTAPLEGVAAPEGRPQAEAGPSAPGSSGGTAGDQDAEPDADPEDAKAVEGAPDVGFDGASGAPTSCADVGQGIWYDSCCEGKYCGGWCILDVKCQCGTTIGGCLWPAVCCGGLCVGARTELCKIQGRK